MGHRFVASIYGFGNFHMLTVAVKINNSLFLSRPGKPKRCKMWDVQGTGVCWGQLWCVVPLFNLFVGWEHPFKFPLAEVLRNAFSF